ncbi:BON domain-containing protein [Sulfuriflexus sp.]|uniref:BON domain-containing protein n=1 Tax=Sulfuriflexus sp. TaxID=2015443 RepID=UPI0028CFCCA7|nr:BON domain-containing protein [Sulfuriflexus sp.]MDT8403448.1 BON domain-containing protein [Sulfuriflexus sp.]
MKSATAIALTLMLSIGSVTLLLNGCAATKDRPSTGQFIDDRTITTKIKAMLLDDPLTQGLKINVDTFKGQVQLNGFVASYDEKKRAEALAKSVGGVISVTNNLEVK